MLSKLSEIAPLTTWGLIVAAALLLLLGFVAYGHARLTKQAYGEEFQGVAAPGMHETMLRWAVACLTAGLLLWGLTLDWPAVVLVALGGASGAALLLEGWARLRG